MKHCWALFIAAAKHWVGRETIEPATTEKADTRMPQYFYRFRPAKALLGPYDETGGRFEELERQEIYFAKPSELNDAMEGFKDLFWRGDEIVWKSLLKHYAHCLMITASMVGMSAATFTRSLCDPIIRQTPDDLPDAPIRQVYRDICGRVFAHPVINELIAALVGRTTPVRREELVYYLRAVSPLMLPLVVEATMKRGIGDQIELPRDPAGVALGTQALDSLCKLLRHPDYGRMPDALAIGSELVFMQMGLLQDAANAWTVDQGAMMFLIRDFPAYYVELLEKLLYPNWYAACFVADPANPSMWGGYGDGHRGVCLKFRSEPNNAGVPSLSLYRACGWSASKEGTTTHYAYVPHPFEEVRYTHDYPEIDFFASLGMVPMPKLTGFWYLGPTGTLSVCSDQIFKNEEGWRRDYWNTFRIGATLKTSEWAYEREYRIILSSNLQELSDKHTRKLKYRFSDLAGISFGIKTSVEDKIRIMTLVEEKCRAEGRTDFEFYQAHYSRQTRKIELVPLTLLNVKAC